MCLVEYSVDHTIKEFCDECPEQVVPWGQAACPGYTSQCPTVGTGATAWKSEQAQEKHMWLV
jgi:hypothetical protein